MSKLKKTDPKTIKLLYQLFYDVQKLFDHEGLSYWIIAGTALGAVRHGGIIPWDDDIDIGIDVRDVKKFGSLKKTLEKCGYGVSRHWLGYKIYYLNIPPKGRHKYSFPDIDVFLFELHKDKIRYSREACRDMWPKEYFYIDEIFPLKKYRFGDYDVWGPREYKEYFIRAYGKKWNIEAYRDYDHENEEVLDKVLVKLKPEDREPAEPTKINKKKCLF